MKGKKGVDPAKSPLEYFFTIVLDSQVFKNYCHSDLY